MAERFSVHDGFLACLILLSTIPVTNCREVLNLTSLIDRPLAVLKTSMTPDLHGSQADDNLIPSGYCKTWIGTVVTENSTWEEQRCRQCRCDVKLGAVCKDPPCRISFHSNMETSCEEWSSDGCCCLRSTCVHDGHHYAANDWFMLTPSDPCTVCQCDPSDGLPRCLETPCPEVHCVDPTSVPGECCRLCLAGNNCGLPPLPVSPGGHLDDVTPILNSTSRLVTAATAGPSLVWNCTCIDAGGDAQCNPVDTATDTTITTV